mmetsp:Transcript_45311/g.45869  ORF Transcript_45311/g.45869 Transcript_45311/m.45869 type:complete len:80 (+) Transcript_45311:54-293(+)
MMKQVLIVVALVASVSAFTPASRSVSFQRANALFETPDLGKDWKETNFEGDLAKVQKDAEERLEEKVAELLSNIENTGC